VALGSWGLRHRPTTPELTVRAQILAESPALTRAFMAELREIHLGIPMQHPKRKKASERLQQAYEAALAHE
jgi:hypothetical protein